MATTPSPRSADELFAALEASGYESQVDWTQGIGDASRLSVERFAADHVVGRSLRSTGRLRLAGDGVAGHAAPIADVADVAGSFQRLVTAVGSALADGNTSVRGMISAQIQLWTRLRLLASPAPGSLVLNLEPESPPQAESNPDGTVPLFGDDPEPLADRALAEVIAILGEATNLGPDPDEGQFLRRVEGLGPRTASALRIFAESLDGGQFDTDVEWALPQQPTLKITVGRGVAREIVRLVETRNLDAETVVITGVMRTVSDLTSWVIDGEDGARFTVDGSEIDRAVVDQLHVNSRVQVTTEMTPRRHVGGQYSYSYTAKAVELLE